jgi:hypothetical protein
MIPHLFYYHLMVLGLLWLYVILHYTWPSQASLHSRDRPPPSHHGVNAPKSHNRLQG